MADRTRCSGRRYDDGHVPASHVTSGDVIATGKDSAEIGKEADLLQVELSVLNLL